MQHLLVVTPEQCEFEAILRWIEGDRAWACRTIKAMDGLTPDSSQINGIVKGAYNTVIATLFHDENSS